MDYADLKEHLNELVTFSAWGIVAGAGTGSMVTINFGEKYQRARPLLNPHVDPITRDYEAHWSLFIENGSWRLESPTFVFCSSKSSNLAEDEMIKNLEHLHGAVVVNATVVEPSGDLIVCFSNQTRLLVFCDCMREDDGDNYSLFTPSRIYTVKSKGALSCENREVFLSTTRD